MIRSAAKNPQALCGAKIGHGIWCDTRRDLYVVQPGEWGRVRRIVKYHRQ
jgi:hypothetical protein